jgi:hypothetical protein
VKEGGGINFHLDRPEDMISERRRKRRKALMFVW